MLLEAPQKLLADVLAQILHKQSPAWRQRADRRELGV